MEIIKKISLLLFIIALTAQNDDVLDDVNKYLKNKKSQNIEIIFVSIKTKLFHIVKQTSIIKLYYFTSNAI